MDFNPFKAAVAKQFERLVKHGMFRTGAEKDAMWTTYLAAFPAGTNPIYKNRTEHDCNCCKGFVRSVGNAVAVIDGKLESVWDVKVDNEAYQAVANAMSAYVKSLPIADTFLHYEKTAGTSKSFQDTVGGVTSWSHFFVNIPPKFVKAGKDIPTALNDSRTAHDVLARGLTEITEDSIAVVLELIAQKSLYRGEEHKFAITEFQKVKKQYLAKPEAQREAFVWEQSQTLPASVSRFRNTVIGTLLTDLSEGKDIEAAVGAFESKVAPTNYKRPTALVTKAMIEKAKKTIEDLGLTSALTRRYAKLADITVNNILFANRNAKKAMAGNVFDDLAAAVPVNVKSLDRVEEVPIEKFLTDILPNISTIELMMENRHEGNLVSLIAPEDPTALGLFNWDNKFSWSYNGNVADSLRQRVASAGGRVDGVLRFSHSWNHVGRNASLMDLHVFMPGSTEHPDGKHDRYPAGQRVGWNNRNDRQSGGSQDVDYVDAAPEGYVPVENIAFPTMAKLKDGTYTFKIHNWALRQPTTSGFKAEIECGGQVFEYEYAKPLANKEWVTVATAELKKGVFTVNHKLPHGATSKTVWGVPTQTFHPVNVVMLSPNHWDGQGVGNKHYFFMLQNCQNSGQARGFFNEFLKPSLNEHRKVIEMVGAKMKTEESSDQLSGLGFSSTQRNHVLCKVTGSFSRTLKITF